MITELQNAVVATLQSTEGRYGQPKPDNPIYPSIGFWNYFSDVYYETKCAVMCWWKNYDCSEYETVNRFSQCTCYKGNTEVPLFWRYKCN